MSDLEFSFSNILRRRNKPIKHSCTLGLGSESMLPTAEGWFNPCRTLKKLSLISTWHPESVRNFISHPSILFERQRQILIGNVGVIHPYSVISFLWLSLMVVVYLTDMNLAPFRFAFFLERSLQPVDTWVLVLSLIGLIDVAVRFNIGFPEDQPYNIVLSRKRITIHYVYTWMAVDLIASLPITYFCLKSGSSSHVTMFSQLLKMIRFLRIITVIKDFRTILKVITNSIIWQRCIRHTVLLVSIMHWCICFIYFPVVVNYYWYGELDNIYCQFLLKKGGTLKDHSIRKRYLKSMFITYSAFFGTGYSRFQARYSDEVLTNAMIILFASIFMVYTLVFILKMYITIYSSTMRYGELMNQVEKYMRNKQFPKQLKRRVRDFYDYRYQGRYFKEQAALDCLSEHLRNEISLYTCQKLIDLVPLFQGLPPTVVGTVLGCLKPEVFMTNDLIMRAGDIGSCMYFISTGTVAVYSMKGAEICHLGDGSHFGEVALLMKDRKRVATVVAVEITHVYRIDAADFRDFVMTCQELLERIETLASKRMHKTVLLDEAYLKERVSITNPLGPEALLEPQSRQERSGSATH